jgi:hypothetical protein
MTAQVDTKDWREHLLDKPDQIKRLLENTHRIAVLGIKPNPDGMRPRTTSPNTRSARDTRSFRFPCTTRS